MSCNNKNIAKFNLWLILVSIFIITLIIISIIYSYVFNVDYLSAFYNTTLLFTTIDSGLETNNTSQQIFILIVSIILVFLFLVITNITAILLLNYTK